MGLTLSFIINFRIFNMISKARTIEFIPQSAENDCGITCLRMIMKYYGKENTFGDVYNYPIHRSGISLLELARLAEKMGFKTLSARFTFDELKTKVEFPCIAYFKKKHFVIIYRVDEDVIYIADPAVGLVLFDKKQFLENWAIEINSKKHKGICLLIEPIKETK